jgi:hypothetical protein
MRKLAICVVALAFSTPAWALNTKDLLAVIAMPLAVNAVSNVTGVSQSQLGDLVTALNQANVQPTQFVQVIRYVPVALDQPGFVQYVQTQSSQGVTGDALVNAIVNQLSTQYNVTPTLAFNGEPTTFVVSQDYIPQTLYSSDPLAIIALPLAVAAVSNVTGVSQDQLANFIATMNNANVPPTQIVEVLRYVPVALTTDNAPQFVQYVQQQTTQGVTGPALVPVVVQQLQTFYPAQTQIVVSQPVRIQRYRVAPPQTIVVDQNFVPPAVVTRMSEHQHGQAEVVHGDNRARNAVVVPQQTPVVLAPQYEQKNHDRAQRGHEGPMISSAPPQAPPAAVPAVAPPPGGDRGKQNQDHGNHGDQGDHGKDGGKGKGHGKD